MQGCAFVDGAFVAPEDADQGISQKIFYVHVPIALTASASRIIRFRSSTAGLSGSPGRFADSAAVTLSCSDVTPSSGSVHGTARCCR